MLDFNYIEPKKKEKIEQKNPIGRPRNNISIKKEAYLGILEEHKDPNVLFELCYTEPDDMKKCLKTMKTNGVENLIICAQKTKVSMYGRIGVKKTKLVEDLLDNCIELHIDCNDIFSYFLRPESLMFVLNMQSDSIGHLFEEINESSNSLKMSINKRNIIRHSSTVTVSITFDIYNKIQQANQIYKIDCELLTNKTLDDLPIDVVKMPPNDIIYCQMMNLSVSEYKKSLNSKLKKAAIVCKILIKEKFLKFEYSYSKESISSIISQDSIINIPELISQDQEIVPNGDKQIIYTFGDSLNSQIFDKVHLSKFLTHIKPKFNIIFGSVYIKFEYTNKAGLYMVTKIKNRYV